MMVGRWSGFFLECFQVLYVSFLGCTFWAAMLGMYGKYHEISTHHGNPGNLQFVADFGEDFSTCFWLFHWDGDTDPRFSPLHLVKDFNEGSTHAWLDMGSTRFSTFSLFAARVFLRDAFQRNSMQPFVLKKRLLVIEFVLHFMTLF